MAYKLSKVTIVTKTIEKQGMLNNLSAMNPGEDVPFPTSGFSYTVTGDDGKKFKVKSTNQTFMIGGKCSVILDEKGNGELLYDVIPSNNPIVMHDPMMSHFLPSAPPEKFELDYYIPKVGLFGGGKVKKRKAELLSGSGNGTNAKAMIIKREAGSQAQVMRTTKLTLHLTLLVDASNGKYFLTKYKHKISYQAQGDPIGAAIMVGQPSAVGNVLDIVYCPNDPSIAAIKGMAE